MRVRLIYPFSVALRRLDTVTTEAEGGYDADFGELKVTKESGARVEGRQESPELRIRAQIEDKFLARLNQMDAGNSPDAELQLVAHMFELQKAGLVDVATGKVDLNVNDRLDAIYTKAGALVHTVPNPPGLYCIEVTPISYGIGGTLNLLLLRFADRAQTRKV